MRLARSTAHAEDKAAILLPGSANDQSWNALGYSILKSLEPHGFKTAYSENVSDADEAEALRDYANQGYEIVMGHSGRFVSAMEQVAPDFPKTQFIAVSGNEGKAPNVMSIDWNNAQFGCQLGHLAARMSKTGKVGGVYGLQGVPNITAQAGGFRICAEKAGRESHDHLYQGYGGRGGGEGSRLLADCGRRRRHHRQAECRGSRPCRRPRKKRMSMRPDAGRTRPRSRLKLVLTNIVEDWPAMFGSTADQVKSGKLFGTFVQYGYDTAPVTGATLEYEAGKAFNPIVPAAVVKELDDMAAQFKTGALKITPTEQDARSGG